MIQTDRLVLNELTGSDVPMIVECYNIPEIRKAMPDLPKNFTKSMAKEVVERQKFNRECDIQHLFAIRLKGSSELIGCVSVHNIRWGDAEIGYWLVPKHWKNGYATESTKAVIDYTLNTLKVKNIYGHFEKNNIASQKVLSKCGLNQHRVLTASIMFKLVNDSIEK